jgi:hypothetical protein
MSETESKAHGCFCMGTGPGVSEMFRRCVPQETRDHLRNSRLEMLKALRSLIDQRIEHLSRAEMKGTTLNVE